MGAPSANDTEPLLLTLEAVARKLSCGRTTIYGLVDSGVLESVKVGRSRRVPADSLERYVAKLRNHA